MRNRFLYLLITLLLYIAIAPLVQDFIRLKFLMDVSIALILLSAIFAFSGKKRQAVIATILALPLIARMISNFFVEVSTLNIASDFFGIVFFGYMIVLILSFIFSQQEITFDLIYGAIVAYLFLGVMWAFIYSLVENLSPGSFSIAQTQISESKQPFVYYSFVTLTTLGYGDITPLKAPARSFAIVEAIIGQVYLTVLVARLVGIHISQSLEKRTL